MLTLRYHRLILIMVLSFGLSSCSYFANDSDRLPRATARYRIHEIRYPGETLGEIADWYTGSAGNWKRLLNDNGFIRTKSLRFGDKIRIDESLMTKFARMPKSFVKPKPTETESPRAPTELGQATGIAKEQALKENLLESIIAEDPRNP